MGITARKRFGQNFLQNDSIINAIVQSIAPKTDQCLIEIGPGRGALTRPILDKSHQLKAIEIDRDLIEYLKPLEKQGLHLIEADALTVNYADFIKPSDTYSQQLRLIGNLPYNISTPLLLHLLDFTESIQDMHFMLQKEVAERLAAEPGTKDYGRLSVMMQYFCTVDILFMVPPTAFYPQPKVDSSIIRIKPHLVSPYDKVDKAILESIVKQGFSQRRKTLRNNFKKILTETDWLTLNIDPQRRPEELTIDEFVRIAQFVL